MARPYRRFIPGRGEQITTVVRALADADLTSIDGQTILQAGQTKVFPFDLQASLRTYEQRKTLNRLLGSRAIELRRQHTETPDVVPTPSSSSSDSSDADPVSGSSADLESSDLVSSSSSTEEEVEDQSAADDAAADEPAPGVTDLLSPDGESSEAEAEEPVEEAEQPVDPLLGDPLLDAPLSEQTDRLSDDDKRALLSELAGVGRTLIDRLLALESPTVEQVLALPRFPKDEQTAAKACEILAL